MIDIVFDGNSLFARSWYAAREIPLDALKYSVKTVISLLDQDSNRIGHNIDRMLFCWDGAQKLDKQRAPKPREYHETRAILKNIITFAFGASHGEHLEFEGDDVVATAVYQSTAKTVYVVSGDKDLMQLEGGNTRYYCLNTKAVLSRQFILNKWPGIKDPCHIPLALAIIGDPVDSIKGIPKWGPKRMAGVFKSVTEGEPFDQVVATVDSQIPEHLKPFFYESLERTFLNTEVPGVPDPAELVLAAPKDVEKLGVPEIDYNYRIIYRNYNHEPF